MTASPTKTWLIRFAFLGCVVVGVYAFNEWRTSRPPRIEKATKEKRLILGNGSEVSTLDPQLATGQPEHMIFHAIFEGLVAPGVDDPDANAPGAASHWETKDYINWTFHLRPEAKWSDGTPVTAHDFVWSYERMLTPGLLAQYASMLFPLKNAEKFNKGEIKDFSEVGVKAKDDYTLEITLVGPMEYVLGMMKHYAWFPVPRHVIEKFGDKTDRESKWTRGGNMVGNGPFRLKEWRFTHSVTVERNPYYWDAATVKLNEIVFLPIQSDATEERAFRDGQLHVTMTMPLPQLPYYKEHRQDVFHSDPVLVVYFYRVNTTAPALKDKRVRRAMALAIDRDSLIKNVLRAGQQPAVGYTPYPQSMGYDAPQVLKFDVAEAKRLLAEAGYPDGKGFPKFDILINTSEGHRTIAEAIQEMWRKHLGIPVGIHNQDWQVYLESQRKMQYSVCRAGWVADYPDPYTFLSIWKTGDGNNETGWSSPAYDELMMKTTLEGDPVKRRGHLREAEAILLDELPIIPVYWYVHSYLRSPEVKNWKPSVIEHRCYKAIDLAP
jgi:oligopeptide transport system substrate-binding protein